MTAADHIAGFLTDRGVEVVFGLCGHTNISLLAALERAGAPRFVTTRHEQVAAHAADGYARASGKPGVVLLHVGPGMTNAVTGVATASFDSIPLLVIAGDVPSYYEGRGPHQEVNLRRDADQVSIYEPFVKRAWRVRRADQLPRTMARAWDLAVAGRPGPVLVSIPMDILGEALDAPIWPASPVERPALSTATAAAIATELRIAQRPLLLAGGGTRRATAQVARLAETVGLPVAHTLMGTGVLPPDHPQLVGIVGFWGSPAANRLAAEADLILAVGTRFPETDSSSWEPGVTFDIPPTRLIHVDIDPHEPGRNYPTTIAATAEAGQALEAILEAYGQPTPDRGFDWGSLRSERESFLAPSRANATSSDFPLLPERILADLRSAMPDAILVTDVGWNKNGVAQQYPVDTPDSFLTPGGFSTMGFGPSAVLGVAASGVDRPGGRAGRRWRFRLEPERRGDGGRDGHRTDLGSHEQRRLRDHRRPGAQALRQRLRVRVPGGRPPVLARLRGDRPGLRGRRHPASPTRTRSCPRSRPRALRAARRSSTCRCGIRRS